MIIPLPFVEKEDREHAIEYLYKGSVTVPYEKTGKVIDALSNLGVDVEVESKISDFYDSSDEEHQPTTPANTSQQQREDASDEELRPTTPGNTSQQQREDASGGGEDIEDAEVVDPHEAVEGEGEVGEFQEVDEVHTVGVGDGNVLTGEDVKEVAPADPEENKYICSICDISVTQVGSRNRHMRTKHGS